MALTFHIHLTNLQSVKEEYPSVEEFVRYFDEERLYKHEKIERFRAWTEAGTIFDRLIDIANFSEDEKYFYFNFFSNLFWLSFSEEDEKYIRVPWRDDLNYFEGSFERRYHVSSYGRDKLASLIKDYSQLDFAKLEHLTSLIDYWDHARYFTNFQEYKDYIEAWNSLFKWCQIQSKELIIRAP